MEENKESKKAESAPLSKQIVAIVAVLFGVVGLSTCMVQFLSPVCALVAVIMGIVVFVKKLDGKILAAIAILLGLVGGFLGGQTTYSVLSAMNEWGPEAIVSDDCTGKANCVERGSEQGIDAEKVNEASASLDACKIENGINLDVDFDDLAESEQEAYLECVKANF